MASFEYESLDLERPTIRLLKLLKAKNSENCDIKCEIFEASFDDDDLIPYEALSYTWGDTILSESVEVNGKSLAVTENLHVALLALRSTEDRILWVDAVCIDQSNIKERGHQVQQMANIYSQADRVIIWLGEGTIDTNLLLERLKRLEKESIKHPCSGWSNRDKRWIDLWLPVQLEIFLLYSNSTNRLRQGLADLMARPWFTRIWILQEVAYAKRAIICCGNESVSARIFTLASRLLNFRVNSHCQAVLDIMTGLSRKTSWWNSRRDLYTLLFKFQYSKASDPRDMIFALLGMCSDSQGPDMITADYTKDLSELVSDAARMLFGLSDSQISTIPDLLARATYFNTEILQEMVMLAPVGRVEHYLMLRGDKVMFTEGVFAGAAANTSNGLDILNLFYKMPAADFRVTQAVFTAAAKNTIQGLEMIQMFLDLRNLELEPSQSEETSPWIRRHFFQITEAVIIAAVENLRQGREILKLLESRREYFTVTEGIMRAAIEDRAHGKELIYQIIRTRQPIIWTTTISEVFNFADENWLQGQEILKFILIQSAFGFQITEDILVAAQRLAQAREIMELFFTLRDSDIILSEAIVVAAVENDKCGDSLMELLIKKRRNSIVITDVMLAGAAGNQHYGEILLSRLLGLREESFSIIPEPVFEAAAKNPNSGVAVLKYLYSTGDITVTENILRAAVTNETSGHRIVETLLDLPGNIEITSGILEAAATNEKYGDMILKSLLGFHGFIKIKSGLLEAAVTNKGRGIEILQMFLHFLEPREITDYLVRYPLPERSGDRIHEIRIPTYRRISEITSHVLEAAASNVVWGESLIHTLLKVDGISTLISDAVFVAAAGNPGGGAWITSLLLSARGNSITITDAMVQAAKANIRCGHVVLGLLHEAELEQLMKVPFPSACIE
ncbi:HET-domain-containing protein [Pyrenochaeta sp. DS3sAY3a]|nr:HET-domain-containing protein [Pyrenochaeta sp. DS3sAY3a]